MQRDELQGLFDLSGRVALVTGGTRGIGRAVAEGFAAAGAKVVVASRKPGACAETQAALEAAGAEAPPADHQSPNARVCVSKSRAMRGKCSHKRGALRRGLRTP